MTEDDIFLIRILNLIAVSVILSTLFSIPFSTKNHICIGSLHQLLLCLTGLYCLRLNYYGKIYLTKLALTISVPTIQFLSAFAGISEGGGVSLTILPFFLVSAILFESPLKNAAIMLYVLTLMIYGLVIEGFIFHSPLVYNLAIIVLGCSIGAFLFVRQLKTSARLLNEKNKELETINAQLQDQITQNELKNQLLSVLGHDLRGPVHAFDQLSDKVSFLLKNQEYDELLELAGYFEHTSKTLFYNLENLLEWTKASRKTISNHPDIIHIDKIISAICQSLRSIYSEKEFKIERLYGHNQKVFVDRQIFTIVLTNLLDNAVKFSPNKAKITVMCKQKEDQVFLSISDEGPGIESEMIKQAQEGKLNKTTTGFGLGLSICYELIDLIGGSLEYHSLKPSGTEVKLVLPAGNRTSDRTIDTLDKQVLNAAHSKDLIEVTASSIG